MDSFEYNMDIKLNESKKLFLFDNRFVIESHPVKTGLEPDQLIRSNGQL